MQHDPEVFEVWYLREHPRLISAMTAISRDSDLAVDATDEAFARASERWARVSRMEAPRVGVHDCLERSSSSASPPSARADPAPKSPYGPTGLTP